MKLSMETMYVPEAGFIKQREMMEDWRATSEGVSKFSLVSFGVSLVSFIFMLFCKDDFFCIYAGSAGLFLIATIFSKKWYYASYISAFLGAVLNCLRFYLPLSEDKAILGVAILAALVGVIPSIFAFRCVYNYNSVFKELKKCKGFPNFIANTADLYADKIYLKDKEKTNYENLNEASYNPFNSAEDIKNEEIRRYHNAHKKATSEPIRMDIGYDGKLVPAEEEAPKKPKDFYKFGKTIFGKEIVFLHNEIPKASFDEKRELMYKWNENVAYTTKEFPIFVFLIMLAVMATGFGSIMAFVNNIVIVLFVLGVNYMKMGRWFGPIFVCLGIGYCGFIINSEIAMVLMIGAFLINRGIIFGTIRYILNYKIYRQLKAEKGFPSFIQTTADMYGEQLYIADKFAPIVKKDPSQRRVKVMDIGYDDKPKKDEGAWNAFDYMDQDKNEK